MSFKQEGINGNIMDVDSQNRGQSLATIITEEHHVSDEDGQSYMVNAATTDLTLTLTATEGPILFLQNNSATKSLIIEKVTVSSNTAAVFCILRKNMTVGSVGQNNTEVPVNLNFESGKAADALAYSWDQSSDGMTNLSAGSIIDVNILGVGTTSLPYGGTIILAKDDNIVLSTEATTAEFMCSFRFYFDII